MMDDAGTCSRSTLRDQSIYLPYLIFSWLLYLWEVYLSRRQRAMYLKYTTLPYILEGICDEETFEKARLYELDKSNFSFWENLYFQVESTFILLLEGVPFLWGASGHIIAKFGFGPEHQTTQVLVFFFLGKLFLTATPMPWIVYDTFVIEEKHGFNQHTPRSFVKAELKHFVVLMAIDLPIVAMGHYIASLEVKYVETGGSNFFIYSWFFTFVISLLMCTIYPDYIDPLFSKFKPLPEGELRTEIEKLASRINFPLKKLYVQETSHWTLHSNAYFYGFFKNKGIVLFDTLLEDCTPINQDVMAEGPRARDMEQEKSTKDDELLHESAVETEAQVEKEYEEESDNRTAFCTEEILAVLGHELGHWYLSHILKAFLIFQVHSFLWFLMMNLVLNNAFQFYSPSTVLGLMSCILAFYFELLKFCINMGMRRSEFQADAFAKSLHYGETLKSALIKLHGNNLCFPLVDWLFSAWYYTHPTLLERLKALDKTE